MSLYIKRSNGKISAQKSKNNDNDNNKITSKLEKDVGWKLPKYIKKDVPAITCFILSTFCQAEQIKKK